MISFLVEDAIHHMPNALCDQVCTPTAVVEIGVVFEESSGQQPVAHADVPRQLAEMFGRHAVGTHVGGSRVVRSPDRSHVQRHEVGIAHNGFDVLDVLQQRAQANGLELQSLQKFEGVRIGQISLMSHVGVVEQVVRLVHDHGIHVVACTDHARITPKIEPGIDRDQIHGSADGVQCPVHGDGQVVASTKHNGHNAHLHEFGHHGLDRCVGVIFCGAGPDVSQVHSGLPCGRRDELIQPMANGVWGTATAFVVSRAPAVVDPKKRHAGTLQHGARIEAMGFDAVSDPRHPFRVGEVGGVDRFEQVEKSVEHEPGF